ncbi:MAG: hypothetical protein ACLPSF_00335 [Methylocella sp.]
MNEQNIGSSAQHLGDEAFMSVADLKAYIAEVESAKASQSYGAVERAAQAKKDLIDKLLKPVDFTPEKAHICAERLRMAAEHGDTELLVARFPSELCTDHARAINNAEEGWPDTLVGAPRSVYEIWKEKFKPLGYRLKAAILDWPEGLPGDVGMYITWD